MTATRLRAIDMEAHAWATLATPEAPPTPRSPNDGACSPGPQPRIARLDAGHEGEFVHLLLALDMPSRVSRFMYAAGDNSLIEHGRRALSNAAWLAGAFVDGRLRGIAEVYDIGATGGVEAAFVVDRRWRRRGLGTALLQASQHWAAASKRAMIRGVFSRSNWPMRRLARTANARLDLGLDEVSAEIPVAARE